ncbi:MAG: AI-2E family transporter [Burkholderiaceae bacterium]
MFNLSPQQRQTLLWLGVGLAFVWLLYLLGPILTPFVAGIVLAYILNPGVERLARFKIGKWQIPRTVASLIVMMLVMLALVALVLILVPVLQKEAAALQKQLPALLDKVNLTLVPWLRETFGLNIKFDAASMRELLTERLGDQDITGRILASLKTGGLAVIGIVGILILLPVVLFYVLVDWHALVTRAQQLIPRAYIKQVTNWFAEVDALLAQFLRGQLSVMLVLAVYYAAALAIAGFDAALPIGLLTGLLIFIPYLGFALGMLLALSAALLQFGDWYGLIAVAVIYGFGQVVESFFLTPRLVGEKIGLHPLAVIFSLMAFGQLFGFVGVFIALPVTAALMVALRHLHTAYIASDFYKKK